MKFFNLKVASVVSLAGLFAFYSCSNELVEDAKSEQQIEKNETSDSSAVMSISLPYDLIGNQLKATSTTYLKDIIADVRNDNSAPSYFRYNGDIYYKLDCDLNKGVGGAYIYIYFSYTNDINQSLYDMNSKRYSKRPSESTVLKDYSSSADAFVVKDINGNIVDMNQGAGGDYVYIVGKRRRPYFAYATPLEQALVDIKANYKTARNNISREGFDKSMDINGLTYYKQTGNLNYGCRQNNHKYHDIALYGRFK